MLASDQVYGVESDCVQDGAVFAITNGNPIDIPFTLSLQNQVVMLISSGDNITSNVAGHFGGVFYFYGLVWFYLYSSWVTDNHAQQGGVAYSITSHPANLAQVVFKRNWAELTMV